MIQFKPIYQTRVWGGRKLEETFGRSLPEELTPFGEAWEISDRDEAVSYVVSEGKWFGKSLTELWQDPETKAEIFGHPQIESERFPLLCKILDAQSRLSIQVHPPAEIAPDFFGEPKSEVWYIAEAEPDAEIYIGIPNGVSREQFETALHDGTVESCVHSVSVKAGDHIYIPSGRLHAIGAGIVIYEIQQNSDTTFRVFDWNRVGLNGKPRDLHIDQSMACINFEDFEPSMDEADGTLLCECDYFRLERHPVTSGEQLSAALDDRFAIITVISGTVGACKKGDSFMIPLQSETNGITCDNAEILLTTWPSGLT